MNDYIELVRGVISKMPKQKAISYLKGAIMVKGDTKVTKELRKILTKLQDSV